jgi:hypothetical protein
VTQTLSTLETYIVAAFAVVALAFAIYYRTLTKKLKEKAGVLDEPKGGDGEG